MPMQAHMTMLEDLKRACWARTSPVAGQPNAWEFRKDCLGNLVRYSDFGNRQSPFGWEIDYIVPRSRGGSNDAYNLQALHWKSLAARAQQHGRGAVEQAVMQDFGAPGVPGGVAVTARDDVAAGAVRDGVSAAAVRDEVAAATLVPA